MKAMFKQIKLNSKEKKLQTKREENLTKETLKKIKETLNQRKIKYEEGAWFTNGSKIWKVSKLKTYYRKH